jgi:AraC-like DNA-binding protein
MTENIHIYEMPESQQGKTFLVNEVKGRDIHSIIDLHKTLNPHRHNYYEILFFIKGSGKHEIDFQLLSIEPNSIHFLSPGQVHLITRSEDYHGYEIVFSRDFYLLDLRDKEILLNLPYFNNYHSEPILNLNKNEFKELLALIQDIRLEFELKRVISEDIIRSYLHIFLMKCKYYFNLQNTKEFQVDTDLSLLSKFKSLVEKNYISFQSVKEYAEMMCISPIVLNNKIKKSGGINASDIIIDRIILEAKRLLLFTDLSNKEIAFRLNYDDPSYFSRIFRKKTNFTPTEFREKMIKRYYKTTAI